ncbi:lectin-like [Erpetoichthys calabaricus]|uniref:Lectin-like n=1 Tax=Erpetoichthys calabaricus TaxID=27687 RepID=A0A8C4XCF3_ERPCA|nr:lectin-like [Erpetoichthys calabaricus]
MWRRSGAALLLLLSVQVQAQAGMDDCPNDWEQFNNFCYKFVKNAMTWIDAEVFCMEQRGRGSHLVSVHSDEENAFLTNFIKKKDGGATLSWMGGTDCYKEGTWLWNDGTSWNYVKWNLGEPNNFLIENCVLINYMVPGGWNDMSCNNKNSFVCKASRVL